LKRKREDGRTQTPRLKFIAGFNQAVFKHGFLPTPDPT
jgi:hypothetical protein